MKELENNKSNMILTALYKTCIYICWFLFGVVFIYFVNHNLTDIKIIVLALILISIYGLRNFFKFLYKNIATTSYFNIKHGVEMHYYKKCLKLNYDDIENMDLNELSNKILRVSYRYTKIISDIGEYIIPLMIGLIVLFVTLTNINIFVSIVILALLIFVNIMRFKNSEEEDKIVNYNDLLVDCINKLFTIKILNLNEFVLNKLEHNKDNNIAIVRNNSIDNDITFNNCLLIMFAIVLISVLICIPGPINKLGMIMFMFIISIKLQRLLFELVPSIKNILKYNEEVKELNNYFINNCDTKYINKWDTISVVNGVIKYKSGVNIKIPDFELKKEDMISIMGKSGQGKSTIIKALSGVSTLNEGNILVDGNASKNVLNCVYISKDTKMLNISLRDNLKLNKDITDEEIINYIKLVNLNEWFNSINGDLDYILDNNISEEVNIKLNFIRGLLLNKEVFFLDTVTECMDIESEKKIATLIKKEMKKKTVIAVTQQSTISNICKKHYFIKEHTLLECEPLL